MPQNEGNISVSIYSQNCYKQREGNSRYHIGVYDGNLIYPCQYRGGPFFTIENPYSAYGSEYGGKGGYHCRQDQRIYDDLQRGVVKIEKKLIVIKAEAFPYLNIVARVKAIDRKKNDREIDK